MSKQEFIDQLRRNISSVEDYEFVNDTISYYSDYIESEIRSGKTEDQVLEQLGEPRLIAKSILATRTNKKSVDEQDEYRQNSHTNQATFRANGKTHRMPVWLVKVLIALVLVVVIVLAFLLLSSLFPIILLAIAAYLIYSLITKKM